MEILEFGNKNNKKIILIHGFQSPYQVWDEYIEYYKNDYHIIVPIYIIITEQKQMKCLQRKQQNILKNIILIQMLYVLMEKGIVRIRC